ncbi:proline-rich protein 14 isoform X2 [Bombina bombina]|uniref:proline-rich protein 14 isoform X2 n=1 Tax=Bombina bombina TaxID=8345 RepID=UPI00235ABA29|nr:proline-rich protein 14 isoform X2 [Bombina bombina]
MPRGNTGDGGLLYTSPVRQEAELGPQTATPGLDQAMCWEQKRRIEHLVASPLEREHRKILSVELTDVSKEVKELQLRSLQSERTPTYEDLSLGMMSCCSGVSAQCPSDAQYSTSIPFSPSTSLDTSSIDSPLPSPRISSLPSPPLRSTIPSSPLHHLSSCSPLSPHSTHCTNINSWSLIPLFHSVRSKLESFAEIFLTPIKGSKHPGGNLVRGTYDEVRTECPENVQGTEAGPEGQVMEQPPETLEVSAGSSLSVPSESMPLLEDGGCMGEGQQNAVWQGTGMCVKPDMNIQLKVAVSSPSPTLCRPPLQRCLSCPSVPFVHTLPFRCTEKRRPRRHSLGTVEESELVHAAFPLTCLKKEKYPHRMCSVGSPWLRQNPQLGNVISPRTPRSVGSPGRCHHLNICNIGSPVTYLSPQQDHNQRSNEGCNTEQPFMSDSDFKESGNCKRPMAGKVSNFQIRKRPSRPECNLTPLGLPKRVRLQKEEFSLEEIYTNKNYRTPTEKRTFETIFEEPVLKGGSLVLTSQRPLRRLIVFRDGSAPPRRRKKKKKGVGRSRKKDVKAVEENTDLDMLLKQKLSQLEAALQGEEGQRVYIDL